MGREGPAIAEAVAETDFLVPNMVCDGCATTINDLLTRLEGVREVKPRVLLKRVYVRYEPKQVDEGKIVEALEGAGFTAVET